MRGRARQRVAPMARDARQLSLLAELGVEPLIEVPAQTPVPAGQCDDDQRLRRCLNQLIKTSSKSREQIAAGMSDLTGGVITASMLNTWTAPSRPNNFPLRYLRAFLLACEVDAAALLDLVLCDTGYAAVDERAAMLARLGQIYAMICWGQSEATRLSAALPITGGR